MSVVRTKGGSNYPGFVFYLNLLPSAHTCPKVTLLEAHAKLLLPLRASDWVPGIFIGALFGHLAILRGLATFEDCQLSFRISPWMLAQVGKSMATAEALSAKSCERTSRSKRCLAARPLKRENSSSHAGEGTYSPSHGSLQPLLSGECCHSSN